MGAYPACLLGQTALVLQKESGLAKDVFFLWEGENTEAESECTASGVPREPSGPGNLAFPQISAPARPHSPPVSTLPQHPPVNLSVQNPF